MIKTAIVAILSLALLAPTMADAKSTTSRARTSWFSSKPKTTTTYGTAKPVKKKKSWWSSEEEDCDLEDWINNEDDCEGKAFPEFK